MRVLIFLYILVLFGRTGHSRCSNRCECKQRRTLVDVTCTDLDDMPQDLPCNTILLNLKSNSITALKKESFSCLGSLVELLLSNNRIRLIEKGVFEDATQLEYIELDSNFIQRIPYLGPLPALMKLSVTRNSLKEWQQQTIRDTSAYADTSVAELAAEDNFSCRPQLCSPAYQTLLSFVGDKVELPCPVRPSTSSNTYWSVPLQELQFSDKDTLPDGVSILPHNALLITNVAKNMTGFYTCWSENGAGQTKFTLKLTVKEKIRENIEERTNHSAITGHSQCSNLCECKQRRTLVDVTCTDLEDMPQDLPCNAVSLNLKSNSITALKKESFSCLGSLVELLLSNNRIRLIEKGVFEEATQLEYIELDSNFIQMIPYLGPLPALLKLSVTRNSLKEWQQQTLRDSSGTRLSSLKLAFNKLQNLPKIPFRILSTKKQQGI
nr:peroxidasin-like [Lytechinus pictus]